MTQEKGLTVFLFLLLFLLSVSFLNFYREKKMFRSAVFRSLAAIFLYVQSNFGLTHHEMTCSLPVAGVMPKR